MPKEQGVYSSSWQLQHMECMVCKRPRQSGERCFVLQWEKHQVFVKLVLTQQTKKKTKHSLAPLGCRKKVYVKKKSQQKQYFLLPPSSCPPPPSPPSPPTSLQVHQLVCDKLFEPLQVLSVELHVVVPGALHPQRLHGALAALVQRHAVGEVDDLVLRAVDHKHRRRNLGNFVDAAKARNTGGIFIYADIYCIYRKNKETSRIIWSGFINCDKSV